MDLRERAALVGALSSAISTGDTALDVVPSMLHRVLVDGAWLHFLTRFDEEVIYQHTPIDFQKFVTTPPLEGLGTSLEQLRQLIEHDREALSAFEELTQLPRGNPTGANQYQTGNHDNVMISSEQGNSEIYALRRLRTQRPDLLDRVFAGEMTPHRAMIEAGFRPQTITVNINSPKSAATLIARATPEFLAELRRLLNT